MTETFAVFFFGRGFCVDTCAGGAFSGEECDAKTWPTADEARAEMAACELGDEGVDWELEVIVGAWKRA